MILVNIIILVFKILFILAIILFLLVLLFFFSPSSIKASIIGAPFLPTSKKVIRKALKLADLKPGEKLYDLGSGTGKVLIVGAREFGADVMGMEYSTPLFILSRINLFIHRIKNGKVYKKDFFKNDRKLNEADVIYLFLTPKAFPKLKDKFKKELKIGTRIVVYSSPLLFWQPVKSITIEKTKIKIFLYIKK